MTGGDRIVALDAVRGFALFGILVVNILGVSGLRAYGVDPGNAADVATERVVQMLFQSKFVSLFSILFGISFLLQFDRLRARGAGAYAIYWRRLVILFAFGMVHVLIQPGEVLMPFALCGALLLLFFRMPWKIVLATVILLMAAPHLHTAWATAIAMQQTTAAASGGSVGEHVQDEGDEREIPPGRSWDPYDGPEAAHVHSKGTLADVVRYSSDFTLARWTSSWVGYLWITFPLPMMMIGLLIGRSGVLLEVERRERLFRTVCWGGLPLGLGLVWLTGPVFAWASDGGWNPWIGMLGNILWVVSALMLALAYGAGIFLLFQHEAARKVLAPLAAVGRLALTNYLLQTVIMVWLFYSFGLGWYGQFGAGEVELMAIAIFAAQAIFSIIWLRYFPYGPFEWLWRCGTYWKLLKG